MSDMHDDVFQRVRNEKDLLLTCGAVYGPIVESADEWIVLWVRALIHVQSSNQCKDCKA